MVPILMGVAVFSVGFFMLIVAVLDLLGIAPRNFGIGERILIYGGGIMLCVLGYYMVQRRARPIEAEVPVQPTVYATGMYQPGMQPGQPGMVPGQQGMLPGQQGFPPEYQQPPPEEF